MWTQYELGESCLVWSLGQGLERAFVERVLHVYTTLKNTPAFLDMGVCDIVPTYTDIALYLTDAADTDTIITSMNAFLHSLPEKPSLTAGTLHRLNVCYDGIDLASVAQICGIDQHTLIALHTAPEYMVAMVGFRPHFPYLLGLDERLSVPRRESPRLRVPAGAVAIGGAQTGIYPCESPGGWHIIASAHVSDLATLQPGDRVQFIQTEQSS